MSLATKMAGGLVLVALVCILVPGLLLWQGIEERMADLERLESQQLELLRVVRVEVICLCVLRKT